MGISWTKWDSLGELTRNLQIILPVCWDRYGHNGDCMEKLGVTTGGDRMGKIHQVGVTRKELDLYNEPNKTKLRNSS